MKLESPSKPALTEINLSVALFVCVCVCMSLSTVNCKVNGMTSLDPLGTIYHTAPKGSSSFQYISL